MIYDDVIIGASIAGLYTGLKLARAGRGVCIIDRRHEIGVPVRCGEATGNRKELSRFVTVDESWIARDVTGLSLHVNDGFALARAIPDTGVVLHRDRFEQALARQARAAGAKIVLDTRAIRLRGQGDCLSGVVLEDGRIIEAGFFIGADGPESRIGQWAGITKPLLLHDASSAAQYRVASDFCNDGMLHFFCGASLIEQGYIWVFPKSAGEISVGAILYGSPRNVPKAGELLDRFCDRYLPGAKRSHRITGCAPIMVCPRLLTRGNVLVVGDAARQVNPLTAGGIMNTLEAADLAVQCMLDGKPERYSHIWARTQRRQQKIFALFKEIFISMSDAELTSLATSASSLFGSRIDRSRPFAFPLIPLVRLCCRLLPRVVRHRCILWA
jgi:digeranylgeranylglycerophospholipid reductase